MDKLLDTVKIRFDQLLYLVGSVLAHEKDICIVQNKLRRRFNRASLTYLCSSDFQLVFDRVFSQFDENDQSTMYFTLLVSLNEQLKKHSASLTRVEQTSVEIPAVSSSEESISSKSPGEIKRNGRIEKLERRLSRLSAMIRDLEAKEMSLAEMEHCDLYVVESNLKKQAYETHEKLIKLRNEPNSIERILHQPVRLTDSNVGHPLISQALEDMVNRMKFFPSFDDVMNTVNKVSQRHQLQLSAVARTSLAERSFRIIGEKLKTRRMADFNDIMDSRLPENVDVQQNDPALDSTEMKNTLVENERTAVMKTQQILEEFCQIYPESSADVGSCEEAAMELESDPEKGVVSQSKVTDSEVQTLIPQRRSLMSVAKTNHTGYQQVYMSNAAHKNSTRCSSNDTGSVRVKRSKQSHVDIVVLD